MDIEIIQGDITKETVDAIVNAAHEGMSGGGGVDGAIHRAAGSQMTGECLNLYGCPTGEARITGGYNLPANYVIHTVGPVWRGGHCGEDDALSAAYRNSLRLAEMQGLKTISFPSISTGAFCFPLDRATKIVRQELQEFAKESKHIQKVRLVCFSQVDYDAYNRVFGGPWVTF